MFSSDLTVKVFVYKIVQVGDDVLARESFGWARIVIEEDACSEWVIRFGRLVF